MMSPMVASFPDAASGSAGSETTDRSPQSPARDPKRSGAAWRRAGGSPSFPVPPMPSRRLGHPATLHPTPGPADARRPPRPPCWLPVGSTCVPGMPDHARPLHEHSVDADPFAQFALWYEEAAAVVRLTEAMAAAGSDGRPSVRMVLLKGWDRRGFVFYTSYRGRKGRELAQNPVAALMFHWDPLGRQVRVEGPVERLPAAESDAYFASRPRGAQVSALASEQSRPIESRELLEARVEARSAELGQGPVPRPAWWGGFRVRPGVFEFWQHRDDRLHDRLVYVPDGGTDRWRIVRLQP